MSYLQLEFLFRCYRWFRAVAGVLVTALRDEVNRGSQAVDGQLVAVPEFIVTLCESTWKRVLSRREKSCISDSCISLTLFFPCHFTGSVYTLFSVLTMWQCDTSSIHYSLGQLVVIALEGHSGSFQGIPDLFTTLKSWCCVPELIPLAPQLTLCHRVVALPFGTIFLQRFVTPCDEEEKQGKIFRDIDIICKWFRSGYIPS